VAKYEKQHEHVAGLCEHLQVHGDDKFDELQRRLQEVCILALVATSAAKSVPATACITWLCAPPVQQALFQHGRALWRHGQM
jgi:hypothetical protein